MPVHCYMLQVFRRSLGFADEICEPILINDVAFLHPVPIGSIVEFSAQVIQANPLKLSFDVQLQYAKNNGRKELLKSTRRDAILQHFCCSSII